MNKNIIVGVGVGLMVVVLGIVFFGKPRVIERVVEKLGAIPGNEVQGDEFIVGGVRHIFKRARFNTGTTTMCSIAVPVGASSTITHVGTMVKGVSTSTTGHLQIYVGIGRTT